MKKTLLLALPSILLLAALTYLFLPPRSPLSPLSSTFSPIFTQSAADYKILGFLPYWNLKKLSPSAASSVTDLAYFSLRLDGSGNFQTKVNRKSEEPGWTNFKRLRDGLYSFDKPLTLVVAGVNGEAMKTLLGNPSAQSLAVDNILAAADSLHATGINIDFEPSGDISPTLRDSFSSFMKALSLAAKRHNPTLTLSVDIYSIAASRPRLWDLQALNASADYVIVMAYDYFQPSSDLSGPVAPLRGAPLNYDEDIVKNLAEIVSQVEPKKVLLGIPFYGYEWRTATPDKYAPPLGSGALATLSRVNDLLTSGQFIALWDRDSLTPYAVATDSAGKVRQIYFENNVSIGLKLDLVKSAHLGGIAIWALGYEGDDPELWETIHSALQ